MKIPFQTGMAISPCPTAFGPVLFIGRLEEGLRNLNAHGFTQVELSLRSTDDVDPVRLKKIMNDLGLQLSAVATGQACLFDSLCLCAEDDGIRRMAIEHFKKISALAADLGSSRVIVGGIRGRLSALPDRQMQYDLGIQAIQECAQWLDERGMTLLIEPINRYETNWILNAREGLAVLEAINVPSAKLLMDTFHMNIEEASFEGALTSVSGKLGYVHIADNTRRAPGQGHTNFDEIIDALLQIGYDGPVIAEILPLPEDEIAVQQTAEFWKSIAERDQKFHLSQ